MRKNGHIGGLSFSLLTGLNWKALKVDRLRGLRLRMPPVRIPNNDRVSQTSFLESTHNTPLFREDSNGQA